MRKACKVFVDSVEAIIEITGSGLTFNEIVAVARHGQKIAVTPRTFETMQRGRRVLEAAIARGVKGATASHLHPV